MTATALISHLIAACAVILLVAHVFGAVARRFGQPPVIGQMVAGIALGPSLFGTVAPSISVALFPASLMPAMRALSQFAVIIFLLGVGYELELSNLVESRRTVVRVAFAAFTIPFAAGTLAALAARGSLRDLGLSAHTSIDVLLFVGVCVSITAVPVLAALVRDNRLAGTRPANIALAAAGLIDLASWIVLVLVLARTGGHAPLSWPVRLGLGVVYVAGMVLIARPLLSWWSGRKCPEATQLAVYVAFGLGSAWVTNALGVQVIFGALLAGICLPREPGGALDADLLRALDSAAGLLLPLFFVVSGLPVKIGDLTGESVAALAVVCVLAFVTKIGGGAVAARSAGQTTRTALTIGVLLSTRGLTELIALSAGLQAALIGTRLYSVLVLMALFTTIATEPLLKLLRRGEQSEDFSVLTCIG